VSWKALNETAGIWLCLWAIRPIATGVVKGSEYLIPLAANMLVGQVRGLVMAKMIEFYVPTSFDKKVTPRSDSQKGKVIEFCVTGKKSA
jgi:hypothetical protein